MLSKVSEYDHSVPLDLERQQFLVEPLLLLKASRLDQQLLWPFKYSEFQKNFAAVVKELALTKFGLSAYGLRHGGASHHRSVLARELVAVQQRGAWRSFSSVRRYEKHGRLGAELQKLPVEIRALAEQAAAHVKRFFERSFRPSLNGLASLGSTSKSFRAQALLARRCDARARPY